jgi:tetratricopeptide (TPR) repeat protein
LKALEALLHSDETGVLNCIAEGKRIREKMGYWYSMYDASYFFDAYAGIFIELGRWEEALELLESVISYNPHYPSSHLHLAEVFLNRSDAAQARKHYNEAMAILDQSDSDFIYRIKAKAIEKELQK